MMLMGKCGLHFFIATSLLSYSELSDLAQMQRSIYIRDVDLWFIGCNIGKEGV